jgi:uncharacterized protein (TIGR02679 family)
VTDPARDPVADPAGSRAGDPGGDRPLAAADPLDPALADRIRATVASSTWGWLTVAVRTAWEADLARTRIRIDLNRLPEAQVAAMADFLGWITHRTGTATVDLGRLDRLLHGSGLAAGLATVLTAAGGPLRDTAGERRANRAAQQSAGERVWADAAGHPALQRHPQLAGWLADERSSGRLPADPAARRDVLMRALTVLAALPDPGTGLAGFAGRTLGRAHALDRGAVPSAVLRALAHLSGREQVPDGAAERRAMWAAVGIAVDTVSSTTLVLGLRVAGDGPLPVTLRVNADAGLAVRLTLAQINAHLDHPAGPEVTADGHLAATPLPHGGVVHVCENPSVIEDAAARLGGGSPPLVCIEGWASVASLRLLTALRAGGAELRYHGDFDWHGLQLAAGVFRLGATPWRFTAADYRAALTAAHPQLPVLGPPPSGLTCIWDADLPGALTAAGLAVEEEHVIEELLGDLAAAAHFRRPAPSA